MLPESIVLPNAEYIRKHVTNCEYVFGLKLYFGIKILVKSDRSFVLDVAIPFGSNMPYQRYLEAPRVEDFLTLKNILEVLKELRCDMYKDSLIPIVMHNALVSISNILGQRILKSFSQDVLVLS